MMLRCNALSFGHLSNTNSFSWVVAIAMLFAVQGTVRAQVYDTPQAAAKDPDFSIQGEYVGERIGVQVIALGEDEFDVVVYQGGLPGSGWDRTPPQRTDGDASTVAALVKSRGLKRIDRSSPTLGAKPPATAVVLFDGTQSTLEKNWRAGAKRTEDGLLIQGATTSAAFQDYTLHLEFRTSFQPKDRGQGRGNSGVYHKVDTRHKSWIHSAWKVRITKRVVSIRFVIPTSICVSRR